MIAPTRVKRLTIVAVGVVAVVSLAAGGLLYLASRAPGFYHEVEELTSQNRAAQSKQFVRQAAGVWNQIQNEPTWSGTFSQSQLNAWLAGDFVQKPVVTLPHAVTEPRVSFDNGRLGLAFRWKRGPVAGVICVTGRIWLPESNLVAIELEKIRAGVIPLSSGPVIEALSTAAASAGLDLEWRQHAGNPVALLRLSRPEGEADIAIERLELQPGKLRVAGHSRKAARQEVAHSSEPPSSGVSLKVQPTDSDFVR